MHGIERFLQDFHDDFELLRGSYRFASSAQSIRTLAMRWQAEGYPPQAGYLLQPQPIRAEVFSIPATEDAAPLLIILIYRFL